MILITDQVEPDNRRKLSFFERAMHCVSNHGLELVPSVGFRDNGTPESVGRIPAFRGLFYGEYDLFRYVRRHNKSLSLTQQHVGH